MQTYGIDAKIYCIATLCLDKRRCGHYFKKTIHRLDVFHIFPEVPCVMSRGDDDGRQAYGQGDRPEKVAQLGNLPCKMRA